MNRLPTPRTHHRTLRLLALLLAFALPAGHAPAQDADDGPTYYRSPTFYIPFKMDPGERRIKQVQLYVSTDQGRSWHPHSNVAPEEGRFLFTASRDGLYWFAVRTIDQDNRAYPLTVDNLRPGRRVVVDTQPPAVSLRAMQPRDGQSGVEWEIQDESLDPGSLFLEYRVQGAADWQPLRAEPVASGRHLWRSGVDGRLDVRLRARDRAGNEGEGTAVVQAVNDGRFHADPPRGNNTAQPQGGRRLVNSKRICFNYDVKDKGPSGVSVVELWYTQDGRSWQKYKEDRAIQPPMCVEVNDEGLYGFTLIARSGVGLGEKPPQVGDPPQVWVEVDLTKPDVHIQNVDVGRGAESGSVTITWRASDKNLDPKRSIALKYAEDVSGQWTAIATGLDNTGSYQWRLPPNFAPYKFFVRVEATDRAGNVGTSETGSPVIVDLAQPKVIITTVEPDKK